jgi:hypothetical protein
MDRRDELVYRGEHMRPCTVTNQGYSSSISYSVQPLPTPNQPNLCTEVEIDAITASASLSVHYCLRGESDSRELVVAITCL